MMEELPNPFTERKDMVVSQAFLHATDVAIDAAGENTVLTNVDVVVLDRANVAATQLRHAPEITR